MYKEKFPKGSHVQVADKEALEQFKSVWKYHHPLGEEQLQYASAQGIVESVGFYHGGDVLYWLKGIPGTWHEACLRPADGESAN